jgi:hypothetical protein
MIFYELRDCSGVLFNIWTGIELGLDVGQLIQTVEYPGVCWEVVQVADELPPETLSQFITPVGPIFVNCTDCQNGVINGCTDPTACNYDPCATIDDGSCFYNNVTIRILCNDPITTCDINANCD